MIDLNTCVAYKRNSDGKLFLFHRVSKLDYICFDPESGEKEYVGYGKRRDHFSLVKGFYVRFKEELAIRNFSVSQTPGRPKRKTAEDYIDGKKNCSKCLELKDLSEFSLNAYGNPVSQCKACISTRNKKYYKKPRLS